MFDINVALDDNGRMDLFLNGKMVPEAEAQVSVHDAGLQHGVGLFETMVARNGRVFRLRQHLGRLADSAVKLGLAQELHIEPLADAVRQTLAHNGLKEARVRLTLTAGTVSLLRAPAGATAAPPQPTLLIVATPPTQYDPSWFAQGIKVLIAPAGANPFDQLAGHKTLAYWGRLRALRQAASAGAGEAIWLNVTNHLAGGCVSNVFLVRDGALLTPIARGEEAPDALPAPVLPGITRAAVLELAQQRALTIDKRMLSVSDLLDADEVFLTNASWGVLPVTSVEKKTIGDGQVGAVTSALRAGWEKLVADETAAGDENTL